MKNAFVFLKVYLGKNIVDLFKQILIASIMEMNFFIHSIIFEAKIIT